MLTLACDTLNENTTPLLKIQENKNKKNIFSFVILGRGNILNAGTIRNPISTKHVGFNFLLKIVDSSFDNMDILIFI